MTLATFAVSLLFVFDDCCTFPLPLFCFFPSFRYIPYLPFAMSHQALLQEMLDISSADEDNQKRAVLRKKQTTKSHSVPQAISIQLLPPDLRHLSTTKGLSADSVPQIKSMSQLVLDNPHMGVGEKGQPLCEVGAMKLSNVHQKRKSAAATASDLAITSDKKTIRLVESLLTAGAEAGAAIIQEEHKTQSAKPSWFAHQVRAKFDALYIPRFYQHTVSANQISDEVLAACLRRGQLFLPLMPAQLESELLCESGRWEYMYGNTVKTYDFPPCARGAQCLSMTEDLELPHPFTCTAMMYPDEWLNFLETGVPPTSRRPCVLCLRDTVVDYVVYLRQQKMYSDMAAQSREATPTYQNGDSTQGVYQLYYNLVDQPGGYYQEHVLQPAVGENIIQPVARPSLSFLGVKMMANRRLYFDQSAIVCNHSAFSKEQLQPHIGENLHHF
jgi:hypothetical protein